MKTYRRQFLRLAASGAALSAAVRIARAQAYPTRPVHLIEGFGAGSSPDIIARLMGQWLAERLGQPFIVENRSGANGNIATDAVVRASPDGHTLLLIVSTAAVNATLYDKLNFDLIRDIAPVASIARLPFVMEVHPSFPAKTVPEFIAHAKANPGKINMGSAGIGNTTHVCGELFKMMTGLDLFHVPYRGAQVITGLLGGQVDVYFGVLAASIEHIKAGRLRALAVTSATRSAALPDVPTVGEFIAGYEANGWWGIAAPKNTAANIIDKLNVEVNAALADPNMTALLGNLGATALAGSPADFGRFIAAEVEKWAKVIKFAGIRSD